MRMLAKQSGYFAKNNLSRGSKDPHKMTITTNLCQSQSFGLGKVASAHP